MKRTIIAFAFIISVCFALPSSGILDLKFVDNSIEKNPYANKSILLSYTAYTVSHEKIKVEQREVFTDSEGRYIEALTVETDEKVVVGISEENLDFYAGYKWAGGLDEEIVLPLNTLKVTVIDKSGNMLEGKDVAITSKQFRRHKKTGGGGTAEFTLLPEGVEYDVRVSSGDVVNTTTAFVPASIVRSLKLYELEIYTGDDSGRGIPSEVFIQMNSTGENLSIRTDKNGGAVLEGIPPGRIDLWTELEGRIVEKNIEFRDSMEVSLSLDNTEPFVENIVVENNYQNRPADVKVYAMDAGRGSGIRDVVLEYSFDQFNWRTAPQKQKDVAYVFSVPYRDAGAEIYYRIRVEDYAGNSAVETGSYTIKGSSSTSMDEGLEAPSSLVTVAAIGIIIIIIVFGFGWRKLTHKEKEQN